jgi:hypothetical protein
VSRLGFSTCLSEQEGNRLHVLVSDEQIAREVAHRALRQSCAGNQPHCICAVDSKSLVTKAQGNYPTCVNSLRSLLRVFDMQKNPLLIQESSEHCCQKSIVVVV